MNAAVEQLVSTLLFEGYALYPYTPGATKNATPTPFGIVYPPTYAARLDARLRPLAGRVRARGRARRRSSSSRCASCRQSAPATRRPSGGWSCRASTLAELAEGAGTRFELPGDPPLRGRLRLRATPLAATVLYKVAACVHNETELARRRLARPEGGAGLEPALDPRPDRGERRALRVAARARRRGRRRGRRRARASTPGRCSRPPTTGSSSGRRSCFPTTRGSRPRASAACSTTPRSRRRCCSMCRRSPTPSASRSPPTIRRSGRWSSAPPAPTPEQVLALHGRLAEVGAR